MGWAVVHHTNRYNPAGDPNRTTEEFIYWIFGTQREACESKAGLLLFHHLDRRLSVRQVEEDSWDIKKK